MPAHPTRLDSRQPRFCHAHRIAPPPASGGAHFVRAALLVVAVLGTACGALASEHSAAWKRGASLVEAPGKCNACHSPAGADAPVGTDLHLAGGMADGWEAPPLNGRSPAPVPWTEDAYYAYLRTGRAPLHGAALGPMRAVVRELAALPAADVRAMAHYLASFSAPLGPQRERAVVDAAETRARLYHRNDFEDGAHIYAHICAPCHDAGPGALLHVQSSLALVASVHSSRPDNVLRAMFDGVAGPARADPAAMPAFTARLDDRQFVQVAAYLRQRFAGEQPPWTDLAAAVARLRPHDGRARGADGVAAPR